MNEARVTNVALIGAFIVVLCAYLFAVQYTTHIGVEPVLTTVSAFCG